MSDRQKTTLSLLASLGNYQNIVVLLGAISIGTVWSLLAGQDANWDLLNYHYYNPFALLNDRLRFDIAPAQLQTYFNPLLDVIPYLMIQWYKPWVFGAVMGGWHGINFWLVYRIALHLFERNAVGRPVVWALVCAVVGSFGPVTIFEIGTTLHDLTVGVFVLGSILTLLIGLDVLESGNKRKALLMLSAAGLLIGLAVGLKLTTAIYVVGFAIACALTPHLYRSAKAGMLFFALGALAGLLLTGGYWAATLWTQFGNPMFPMMNGLFKSPYVEVINLADTRFMPKSLVEWLFFPFMFTLERHAGLELPFRDVRFALFMTMLVVAAAIWGYRSLISASGARSRLCMASAHWTARWLIIYIVFSYLAWLWVFSIYRYMTSLESLIPTAVLLLLSWLVQGDTRRLTYIAVSCFVLIVVFVRAPDFGRIEWQDRFFGVKPPLLPFPDRTLVLIISTEPLSFVIPSFPREVRFIRLESNLYGPAKNTKLTEEIRTTLALHRGDAFVLTSISKTKAAVDLLQGYGRDGSIDPLGCEPIPNRMRSDLVLCPVVFKS